MNSRPLNKLRYLLLQIRKQTDPMLHQEVDCFAWALDCDPARIGIHDLLTGAPAESALKETDIVLIGGSGDFSTVKDSPWLDRALGCMRDLHSRKIPTFGSCWGFQALAKALGGHVITDLENAELGTPDLTLTAAGKSDPVFGKMPDRFPVLLGHEDRVVTLPENAVLLASTEQVENQALKFTDAPCYATQFHPELERATFLDRIRTYPQYVDRILNQTFDEFEANCREVPATADILRAFVREFA